MKRIALLLITAVLLGSPTQTTASQESGSDASQLGPGVSPPKIIYRIEPEYSRAAADAQVQGTVLIDLVIDEQGFPQDVAVLSPLGFGLDERAVECVSRWRFHPATKDGKPVKITAKVEVNFRLLQRGFDSKKEEQRTQFNSIITRLAREKDPKPSSQDVQTMQDLAKHKFPAAQYEIGVWQINGDILPKDASSGLASIQKAAERNYPPALFFIGRSQMLGNLVPKDAEKGLSLIRDAATLGSKDAQFTLGEMYEKGDGVPVDLDRAKTYFRLCAAYGTPDCQFRLGTLLLASPQPKERDWLQAIAWLELANDHHLPAAQTAAEPEQAKLTPKQVQYVAQLKRQLEHTP